MIVNTSVKLRLSKEEENCLEQAKNLINEMYDATRNYECEVEFDDGVYSVLDEIQSTIRNII